MSETDGAVADGATVIPVGDDYDVVVGHGVSTGWRGLLGDGTRNACCVVHPRALTVRRRRGRGARRRQGCRPRSPRCPTRRRPRTRQVGGPAVERHRAGRLHPHRRRRRGRRRHRHRPRRLRRGHLAARGARGARADDPAGDGRRRRRGQDRHQHRRGQEPRRAPSTRRPGCSATSTCSRPCRGPTSSRGWPRSSSAGFIADPVILDLVEADPARLRRAGTARTCASSSSGPIAVKADVVAQDLTRVVAARDPQLRPHLRPRRRAGRALPAAARRGGRHRHGLRRRARPSRRPARRRAPWSPAPLGAHVGRPADDLPRRVAGRSCSAVMRRDKKSRGSTCCASSCSTDVGASGAARRPRRGLAARRLRRHLRLTLRAGCSGGRPGSRLSTQP